jgi:hypothetical protein
MARGNVCVSNSIGHAECRFKTATVLYCCTEQMFHRLLRFILHDSPESFKDAFCGLMRKGLELMKLG